jgi:transposase
LPDEIILAPFTAKKELIPSSPKCRQNPVVAALTYEWNNGRVEGYVNRLKLVKRSMYGRAKPDLLKARMLKAA